MTYTETTTTSWFTKLKNGLVGTLIGIVLILAAIYFLFTNEGRAIQTYRALVEGAGLVQSIESSKVDPANEGKLVHISGPVKAIGPLSDDQFGVEANGALELSRNVEMYQWVEKSESTTEKNLGGSETTKTTYSYAKEWKSTEVNSSEFKQPEGHQNPGFSVNRSVKTVDQATVGAFTLEGYRVASLGDDKQISLTQDQVDGISGNLATSQQVQLNQGDIYVGRSATSPQIGDMKISFTRTDLSEASFVASQKGETLAPFVASNGREIFLSAAGDKDAAAMFQKAQDDNTMITWIIRAAGLLGIFIGFKLFFGLFGVIGDVIPFIGSIVRGGTSLIALVLTLIIGPVVIAIGWFAYRPLLAIGIIAAGVILAAGFIFLRRKKAPVGVPPLGRPAV